MITVDLGLLLRRLNRFCATSLEGAAGLCVTRSHYEVCTEHFLLKLIEEPFADVQTILKRTGSDPSRVQASLQRALEQFRSGNTARPVFAAELLEWVQDSWMIASVELGLTQIRSGVLLASLVAHRSRYAVGDELPTLCNVSKDELKRKFLELTAGSSEDDVSASNAASTSAAGSRSSDSALTRFTIDFTARARADEIDPVFCRDREIRQMIDILARRRKNNPILVGEAGVGKTAVVEGLALRVAQRDVPDILKDVEILVLDLGLLQAGAGVRGEFENRLKSVIAEVKASPKPIILFIDEAHTLIGAGGASGGGDAANLLKPALARGELRTIAATTWSEYKKYFEKDAALARRFQLISLEEPSEQDAITILRGLRPKYEASHQVKILDEAIVAAAQMSSRYISGRQLPDKAVDLLDTTAARIKIGLSSRPDALEDAERTIQVLSRELEACRQDKAAGVAIELTRLRAIEDEISQRKEEYSHLEQRWFNEKAAVEKVRAVRGKLRCAPAGECEALEAELHEAKAGLQIVQGGNALMRIDVDSEVVAKVVSDWTGIPAGKMLRDEAQAVLALNQKMRVRIRGQDSALDTISHRIRASKAGLGNPHAPIGVFLLAGPSGVGKTETALCLADLLFGGERFMVTVNMSEFQEKHSVARLIGSPPGYVGYGEGGVLTEAVRQRPYSVVLLDEVEKADPEVLNLFYQVFDKGTLADGEGRVIDFKNTVIFLTTNLGSDAIILLGANTQRPSTEEILDIVRPDLVRHFKPALLARMAIVPYFPINAEAMREIVELKLQSVAERLRESHGMALDYSAEVAEHIALRCTEVDTGARNIDHIVQNTLLPRISTEILERMGTGTLPAKLQLGVAADGTFAVDFPGQQSLSMVK